VPPAELPFATASWGHRILALVVDWFASNLVVVAFLGPGGWSTSRGSGFYALGMFVVESAFFMALLGGSFGQLATRLRVVRVDGSRRPLSLLIALLRQVLVCLVIPPLVFRPDGRGLHDLACGSATVPLAVLRLPGPERG
jgi:uncharacterized RDD family membrane protein YckC